MTSPIHFYVTFNPYLNTKQNGPSYTQAHEFYDYLKNQVKADAKGYAYWGKIIGMDRDLSESKVPFDQCNKVIADNLALGCSTHLYISDFTHLWVGKVEAVERAPAKKDLKTLPFYEGKKVEVWFKITDLALLTYSVEETASKMAELYIDNDYMNIKINGLSPYTTGVRWPVFVQDIAEEMYFDQMDEEESVKLVLKFNPAVSNTHISQVLTSIHHYVFPEHLYAKIPYAAKTELESAELDVLELRQNKMGRNAFCYIKAFEIIMNDLIIHHLKRMGFGNDFFVQPETMPPKLYLNADQKGVVPIAKFMKNYSINQLVYFVERCNRENNFCFKKAYAEKKMFVQFITKDLPTLMEEYQFTAIRGILAHSDAGTIEDSDAHAIRNLVLGIGCTGLIHKAYQTFSPEEFGDLIRVKGRYDRNIKSKDGNNKEDGTRPKLKVA